MESALRVAVHMSVQDILQLTGTLLPKSLTICCTSAHAVLTHPRDLFVCRFISELTLERSHTRARNVGVALITLQTTVDTCVRSIQLVELCYINVLIVPTLLNIAQRLCNDTSVLILERSHEVWEVLIKLFKLQSPSSRIRSS